MKHMVFALFQRIEDAEDALLAVARDEECRGHFSVVMRRDHLDPKDVRFAESACRCATRFGLVAGAAGGALLCGLLAGPLGLVGGGPLFAALLGGAGGSVLGALHGAFAGATIPDPNLEALARGLSSGRVLISVETQGLRCQQRLEEIFLGHGAASAHRSLM